MNAYQRRNRRQPEARALADTIQFGRDYMVSYFLNEFQRGSMVVRFDKEPTRVDLLAELAKYGLEPSALKDVSASPMASVKDQNARYEQAQRATRAAHAHSQTLHVHTNQTQGSPGPLTDAQQRSLNRVAIRQQAPDWPVRQQQWDSARTKRPGTRKVGFIRSLVGLFIGIYIIAILMAGGSYAGGADAAGVGVPVGADLGQQINTCASLLDESARGGEILYGGNPGFFEDRVSTFPPHPANVAYFAGCLLN